MTNSKTGIVAILIAVIALGVAVFQTKDLTVAGQFTELNHKTFTKGFTAEQDAKIGTSGTALDNVVVTTCNPTANTSIAASSTGFIYCTGLTGVTSSDYVFAQFSTSTTGVANNWSIVGVRASTTAGAVDIRVMNLTGAAAVPSAVSTVASGTKIIAIH